MSDNNSEIFTPESETENIGKVDFETLKNLLPKNIVTESETIKK